MTYRVTSPDAKRLKLRRGLDLPIPGVPTQVIEAAAEPRSVALLGDDYPEQRFSLRVREGDRVRTGEALFTDRRNRDVKFVSPAAGTVAAIRRGDARRLVSVVVEREGVDSVEYARATLGEVRAWTGEQTAQRLLEAGDWVALRARPFGSLAAPGTRPAAIFVRAMDSSPLAADAAVVVRERLEDLQLGLTALSRLTDGPLYLCSRAGTLETLPDVERLKAVEVAGPHPAGLIGTQVHRLFPVSRDRRVWYVGYQDVLAIGHLLREGRPDTSRIISLAGPAVRRPRLVRTEIGASSEDLVSGELDVEPCRVISGSVLSGRTALDPGAFLGRYHEQLCAIPERTLEPARAWWVPRFGGLRRVPGWRAAPEWSTGIHSEPSRFVPLDLFDRVNPLRLPLSPLLRALAAGDAATAATFGALELEEEDLALATYLCPAKLDYGPLLRSVLEELRQSLP